MKTSLRISKVLQNQTDCIIMASKIYIDHFKPLISEAAYYQTLTRLCNKKELIRLAPGIYCIPKKTGSGLVLPPDKDIINFFTGNEKGVIVGFSLYNSLGLTDQAPKTIQLLSSRITENKLSIKNISVVKLNIRFTESKRMIIRMLDILNNYKKIEDINLDTFYLYCELYADKYNEFETKSIIEQTGYPKRTIAFLVEILDYFKVEHDLNQYLSPLSKYNIPDLENIFKDTSIEI